MFFLLRTVFHPIPVVARTLAVLALALGSGLTFSSTLDVGRGRIRGTVRALDSKPAAGLQVRLVSADVGMVRITNTDDRGIYAFEDLAAGSYDVEVSGTGFESEVKERILVRPPFRNIVDFNLAGAPVAGQGISVAISYEPPAGEPVFKEVAGSFTDREKKPIVDVLMVLTNPVTGSLFSARSDREGKILIPKVPVGTYRAVISSPGYVTVELKAAQVSQVSGLTLSLSLVEYPLHFEGRVEDLIPKEQPVPPTRETVGS